MALTRAQKEATLKEVLAEVTLLDVGRLLKGTFAVLGCLGILYAIVFGGTWLAGTAMGIGWSDLGIPVWAFWTVLGWIYVYGATSERSFHELNASWYFPKLGWLGSLLLAGYLTGFVLLSIEVFEMDYGLERLLAGLAVWLGYFGPFTLFCSAINIGHMKLLEKRERASSEQFSKAPDKTLSGQTR